MHRIYQIISILLHTQSVSFIRLKYIITSETPKAKLTPSSVVAATTISFSVCEMYNQIDLIALSTGMSRSLHQRSLHSVYIRTVCERWGEG